MPIRKSPTLTAGRVAANRANAQKSTGPRTEKGKRRVILNLKRHFDRLLGLPEARLLNQEAGAGIHLYYELIAPYEPAPPLLAMHFRDLVRLQVELQAWESIRDAQLEYRDQQTRIEVTRRRLDMDRELAATAKDVFEVELYRLPDSFGKFRDQCEALMILKGKLQQREYGNLEIPLRRLYGKNLLPEHERGQIICGFARSLMDPTGRKSLDESQLNMLMGLVEEEERDVMDAWDIALKEKTVTVAASRARLAPAPEDAGLNRQGERLRQAIDRKMRLTPALLKALGLEPKTRPARPGEDPEKNSNSQSQNVVSNQADTEKEGASPKPECPLESTKEGLDPKPSQSQNVL